MAKLAPLPLPDVLAWVALLMLVAPTDVRVRVASFSVFVPPIFDPAMVT